MEAVRVDLGDPRFAADPYPALMRLRHQGPMLFDEATRMWLATTHAAVSATLRSRHLGRLWSDREPAQRLAPFNALHRHQMMENEPPVHTRLRRVVASAFGRGHVERVRPRVEAIAAGLLDALPAGRADILAGYAEPLPVAVIAAVLGIPDADRSQLRSWSQAIVAMYEYRRSGAVEPAAITASVEFGSYVRDLLDLRRRHPGEDLLSDLLSVGELTDDELVATVVLLLNAGHEASVNAFGNAVVTLLRHPTQRARLGSGEVALELALEEMLRYDAPLQLFERTATRDVVVEGQTVRRGDKVAALLGSANRDELVFAAADRFEPARTPNPHLGFGLGIHFCLGAPLARLELQVSLRMLLERFPRIALAADPTPRPTFVLHGYRRIDVDLGEPA